MARKKTQRAYGRQGDLIRLARDEDFDFIRKLSGEAFSAFGAYGEIIPQWIFNTEALPVIYVKDGQEPLGFALLSATTGEVLAIGVIATYQRKGIGSALLRYVESLAAQRGLGTLFLHTARQNETAQAFFEKAGFKVIGAQKKYYPRGQEALIMCKAI